MPSFPLSFPVKPSGAKYYPSEVEYEPVVNGSTFISPFTAQPDTLSFRTQYWRIMATYPPMLSSDALRFQGFLANLRGVVGSFYWTVPPWQVQGSAFDIVSISSDRMTVSASAALEVGKFFQKNNQLFMVTGDAGGGNYDVFPRLNSATTTGSADITDPQIRVRLTSPDAGKTAIDVMKMSSFTIPMVEVPV